MENTGSNKESIDEMIATYKEDIAKLVKYLPWLEKMSGQDLTNYQTPEGSGPSALKVPVYDSTLLAFIKEVKNTKLMRKNYVYTFSRRRIISVKDELRAIAAASLMEIQIIGDIMAKYILGGQSKSILWNMGLYNGVYRAGVARMKELIEYWTVSM